MIATVPNGSASPASARPKAAGRRTYVGTYRLVRDAGGVALTVAEVERAIVVP